MIKRLLLISGFFLIIFALWNIELIGYGVGQASGQFKVIAGAQPIEDYLDNPAFPDSLKSKLQLIQEIRRFAIDSLGIDDSKNYRTLYDQKGEDILWIVTASPQFSLQPKTWKFPILGSFSYKGYFDLQKASDLKMDLEKEDWDVGIRPVTAWSTLGWFSDPILSKMLNRTTGGLANLIIHELTHATLYVKDSVTFNENLASFVGDKGAEKFLIFKYGRNSAEYLHYLNSMQDKKNFTGHFLRGMSLLDSLYKSFEEGLKMEEKQQLKHQAISSVVRNLDTIAFYFPQKYQKASLSALPNNTYFLSFVRYESILPALEREYQEVFNGDLKEYLNYLKNTYPSL